MKRRYPQAAEEELRQAASYLNERRYGYGARLVREADSKLELIGSMPLMYGIVEGTECRECLLLKYSYSIIYAVRKTELVVVAVAHAKRQRGYWVDRLTNLEDDE